MPLLPGLSRSASSAATASASGHLTKIMIGYGMS
jgi:hypothetical protein